MKYLLRIAITVAILAKFSTGLFLPAATTAAVAGALATLAATTVTVPAPLAIGIAGAAAAGLGAKALLFKKAILGPLIAGGSGFKGGLFGGLDGYGGSDDYYDSGYYDNGGYGDGLTSGYGAPSTGYGTGSGSSYNGASSGTGSGYSASSSGGVSTSYDASGNSGYADASVSNSYGVNYRRKRSATEKTVSKLLESASKLDKSDCTKKLLCEIFSESAEERDTVEQEIVALFKVETDDQVTVDFTKSSVDLDIAALVGRQFGNTSCQTLYKKCPYTKSDLMSIVKVFKPVNV